VKSKRFTKTPLAFLAIVYFQQHQKIPGFQNCGKSSGISKKGLK
jgi:hypothetical protein